MLLALLSFTVHVVDREARLTQATAASLAAPKPRSAEPSLVPAPVLEEHALGSESR